MDERNPLALALAFKRAKAKSLKIKELGVTPEMKDEDREGLIFTLAEKKAVEVKQDPESLLDGQEWYVNDLIAFSKMSAEQRLDAEYQLAFPESATPTEMVEALKNL